MKRSVLWLGMLLSLLAVPAASCQTAPKLALDPAKPIVYLEFDHAGPRTPEDQSEPPEGIWLRLVNNSVLTVRVHAWHTSVERDRLLVEHWIVAIWGVSPKNMPGGYASDIGESVVLGPGKSLIFSVPENHVSPQWGMEVPFQFDLPAIKHGAQPSSLVRFGWSDIPESIQKQIQQGMRP